MANTIIFYRIAASNVLLFCTVFSHAFYVFYIAADRLICRMDDPWQEKQILSESLKQGRIRLQTLCL